MAKIIRNIDIVEHTYCGQTIAVDESYTLQYVDHLAFANCNNLLVDISNGKVQVNNGISDIEGVSAQINFLKDDLNLDIDTQGRQITRIAAGKSGWTYFADPIEFETSKLGSLHSKKADGSDRSGVSLKFYKANGDEVTDAQYESEIVKTVLLFKPNYDYELIAGSLHQVTSPSTNMRVWVHGGIIELGEPYVKEFLGGINMKFIGADESLQTDGRAAKFMKKDTEGVPYQTNQLQIVVKHDAGIQHPLMFIFEYFRE